MSPFVVGLGCLAGACVLWGSGHPVLRWLTESMAFESLLFWRWLSAFSVSLIFAWPHVRREAALIRAHWTWFLGLGVTGVALTSMLTFAAAFFTPVLHFSLLGSTSPLWVLAIGWATRAEAFRPMALVGVLMGLFGVVLIVSNGQPAAIFAIDFNIGDVMAMIGAFTWAGYTLLMRRKPAQFHMLTVFSVSTAAGILCVLPLCLKAWILDGAPLFLRPEATAPPLGVLAGMLYTALGSSLVGLLLWNNGVSRTSASTAGVFLYLIPMVSSLLAMLFLGETLALHHLAAAACVLPGMYLATRAAR